MKTKIFRGKTPSQAFKKAKLEIGDDGILLETREIEKDTLYEVVVGIEEDRVETHDIDSSKELKSIKSEIVKLTDKVRFIQDMVLDEQIFEFEDSMPSEFADIYRVISKSGIDTEHLNNIMRITLKYMPMKMRENPSLINKYFRTLLKKMILVKMEKSLEVGIKKVIMLVGPTGVGKTTSVAKLAARYSYLMQERYKVGLIVLDTYRIGGVEQLTQYARIMKLDIKTVTDSLEFSEALDSLEYCDYVLIDTMGLSPYDQNKIEKIHECLEMNDTKYDIDVTLVMPSSTKREDLKIIYENFSILDIDTVMFTKLDETKEFGNIFSFVYDIKKPINYFSVGQEVPEDLVCASSDFLVECLLDGFKRDKI